VVLTMTLSSCGPSAFELQAKQQAERLKALHAQLSRHEQQLADLQGQLTLTNEKLARIGEGEKAARSVASLQVVRLVPERGEALEPSPSAALRRHARPLGMGGPIEEPPAELNIDGDRDESTAAPLRVTSVPPPPNPNAPQRNEEAETLFRSALAAFGEGKASEAGQLFDRFMQRFPAHESADRALYWLAEARVESGELAQAVTDFRLLLDRYPRSSKAADALLELGLVYERQGEGAKAKQSFTELMHSFPHSAQSELARDRLALTPTQGAR